MQESGCGVGLVVVMVVASIRAPLSSFGARSGSGRRKGDVLGIQLVNS